MEGGLSPLTFQVYILFRSYALITQLSQSKEASNLLSEALSHAPPGNTTMHDMYSCTNMLVWSGICELPGHAYRTCKPESLGPQSMLCKPECTL